MLLLTCKGLPVLDKNLKDLAPGRDSDLRAEAGSEEWALSAEPECTHECSGY